MPNSKIKSRFCSADFRFGALLSLLLAVLVAGCRTESSLSPQDLSAPGWTTLRGQAIWKPPQNRPEITGDLILATNANGNCFIAFSKSPFVIATASVENEQWEVRFGDQKYAWRGSGVPPDRFLWFQLPRALLGGQMTGGWKFDRAIGSLWRLQNPRTGETLSGEFFP